MKQEFTKYKVIDTFTGKTETVVNSTSNSFEVTQSKLTEAGIDCSNWFTAENFKKRFNHL